MRVAILGSGIIGVTTAYYLNKLGYQVEVYDRRNASAMECSYANGGQLSFSHIEPWATPYILKRLPNWLISSNSPLSISDVFSSSMWRWMAQFVKNCNHQTVENNCHNMWPLADLSYQCLKEINEQEDINYKQSSNGTLHIFRSANYLASNLKQAEFQQQLGCDYKLLSNKDLCIELEPALKNTKEEIAGGIYYPMDASGDVHIFVKSLEEILADEGVIFHFDTQINRLVQKNNLVTAIDTNKGEENYDAIVVALGAYSKFLLRDLGINIPIYPLKGHSISVPLSKDDLAPKISITDQHNKLVYSRLGDQLRVAGLAEFYGFDQSLKPKSIKKLKNLTAKLFPSTSQLETANPWSCLRPATPDCSPIISKTAFDNLFVNTGHGTLGWTLSFGSAKIIADLIDNKSPDISITGFNIDRF